MDNLTINHVNIRTKNLFLMINWYKRILDLKSGSRPNFNFEGAWLYTKDKPVLHLIVDPNTKEYNKHQQLEHFAFTATGLDKFLKKLNQENVSYNCTILPQLSTKLVNIYDYDGNHLHVDFNRHEDSILFNMGCD